MGGGTFPHLREKVESKLVFSLEKQLMLLQEKLQAAIENWAVGSHIRLHGTVETITPEALYLTSEGVRIPFHLAGALSCAVKLNSSNSSDPAVTSRLLEAKQATSDQSHQ